MKSIGKIILVISLFAISPMAYSQNIISGQITDYNNGEPLIGVSILIKGQKDKGTITDTNGNYQLSTNSNLPLTLKVQYIGFQSIEKEVYDTKGPLNIRLHENSHLLDEVVVTALGKARSADELGSTASVISKDKIVSAGTSTLINALSGKAAGVRISSPNGEPGSGSNIIIRGANTFIGESQPLIILDGTPISNESSGDTGFAQQSRLNDINPNDIESLQILKGASASALWGSRAANGVIVITTKNGSHSSKPNISYTYSKSVDWISQHHPLQSTWGQGTGGKWNKNSNYSWGDKISDRSGASDVYDKSGGYFVAESGNIYYPILQKNSKQTYVDSNFDAIFRTGGFDQHELSISGGGDRANYYLSYGGLFQDGVTRGSYYNKHNFRINANYRFSDWVKSSAKITYINTAANRIQSNGDNVNGAYLSLLRTPADFDIRDYKGTYINASGVAYTNRQRMYRNEIGANSQPTYNNPLWSTNEQEALEKVSRFIITPELLINPFSWLDLTLRGGIDFYNDSRDTYYPINSATTSYTSGYYNYQTAQHLELNFDAIIRATHRFSNKFTLIGTAGYSINDRNTTSNSDVLTPFDVQTDIKSSSLSSSDAATSWTKLITHIRSNRGYAIADIELYDQLFISATGMLESASTVSKSHFYPSVDAAWQFTHILKSDFLSFGKLRASWGKVGTQPEAYRTTTLATATNGSFGGSYAVSSTKGNNDLKPEVKTEWEIGTDLRLFNNKLSMKFTYYNNVIHDLLYSVALNPSQGYGYKYSNAGTMKNHGVEFETVYHVFDKKEFSWDINLNFSQNKNRVTELGGTGLLNISSTSVALEGYSLGVLYRPGALRDSNGNLILDKNGFPQLSTSNVVLGDPNPKWRGGLGMDFRYKNFDFSFLFEHSHGGKYLNRTQLTLYGYGVHQDVSHEVTLTSDVVNYTGKIFKAGTTIRGNLYDFGAGTVLLDESWYNGLGGGLGINKVHDFYVQDNTWTKLRNITLGYTLDDNWFKHKTGLNSVRFSVTGRDLLLWTNLVGIDPESNNYGVSNAQGMDYFSSPATRSLIFSININY